MAVETDFLPQGGMRYTISNTDLTYLPYMDEQGHSYVNTQTGEIDPTLAFYNDSFKPSSSFRRSYLDAEKFQSDMMSAPLISNINYWVNHPVRSVLAIFPGLYINTKGHITIRVQYSANGMFVGSDSGDFKAFLKTSPFQLSASFSTVDANNNIITSVREYLPNASKIGDFNVQRINQPKEKQDFFPIFKIVPQLAPPLESSIHVPEGGFKLWLILENKAPGIGFTITNIVVETRPD